MKVIVFNAKDGDEKRAFIEFVDGEKSTQIEIPQYNMSKTEALHFLKKLVLDYQRAIEPVRVIEPK